MHRILSALHRLSAPHAMLFIVLVAISLGAGRYVEWRYQPVISNAHLSFPQATTQTLPDVAINNYYEGKSSVETKQFVWSFTLFHISGKQTLLQLVVDDCVEMILVNGRELNIAEIARERRCDVGQGFTFDFTPYLQPGGNEVAIQVADMGGGYKVGYTPRVFGMVGIDQLAITLVLLPWIILWRCSFLRHHTAHLPQYRGYTIIFYVAVALYLFRFLVVAPIENTHDYQDHINYIRYIVDHFWRPNIELCRECYQPPLYYWLAGAFYGLGQTLGLYNPENALKALALIHYFALISISFLLLQRLRLRPDYAFLGFALFMFWPIGFIKATDINTDIPVAALILLSLYFTLRWYESLRLRDAACALSIAAIGILVKSNAIVAFAIFGAAALMIVSEKRLRLRQLLNWRYCTLGVLAVIVGCSNLFYLYANRASADRSVMVYHTLEGNTGLWFADDKAAYYLTFPYETFLSNPFLQTFTDASGRKYFWNSFLKTSLFGEWSWSAVNIAVAMNAVLLAMVAYVLLTQTFRFFSGRTSLRFNVSAIYGVASLLLMASLLAFRISQPAGPNQDMRYIYAIMPLFCMLYMSTVDHYNTCGYRRIAWLGIALSVVMIGLSIAHLLLNYGERFVGFA